MMLQDSQAAVENRPDGCTSNIIRMLSLMTDSDAGRTDVVKRRILIVDDEPGILKGCDRVLTALVSSHRER